MKEPTNRREALVGAAFQSIARDGLEGLRLHSVAREAGIDHSTLHHYFETKQDLIEAVVERATTPLRGTMPDAGTPEERLRGHLSILAELIAESPDLFVVLAEIDLRARRDQYTRGIIEEVESGWRRALAEVLGQSDIVELVIAVVKGVRLRPEAASGVLDLLTYIVQSGAAIAEGSRRED